MIQVDGKMEFDESLLTGSIQQIANSKELNEFSRK
jgi:hypothetical protein